MSEREYLKDRPRPAEISRRAWMGRTAALAAGALAATATGARAAPAAPPIKKGGLLRLGLAGASTTDSLEPASYANSLMIVVGRGLFNGLAELTADGLAKPDLAASWEARDEVKDWIVNLRKGVNFSNGQEFNADDAIYSLNLHRGDSKSGAAGMMKVVTEIKKLDKYQIQISLRAPDADFPYVLTDPHLLMVPDGFKDWPKPIGTGGYGLEKFEPGVRVSLKKRRDYWKEGRGNLDSAEISVISDGAARINALISGEIDIINRVDHKVAALLQKTPATEIVRAQSGRHAVMAMEIDKAPFDNPDVRLALKYAVDRDLCLRALLSGCGALGNDHPIPSTDPYFNKDLPQRKHDPDKAAFYIKKAGLGDPQIGLQASEAAFAGALDMAALFQSSVNRTGLKMQVNKEPVDGFWDRVWLKGAFITSSWDGRPAATHMLESAYASDAPWNETHWKNAKFDKLLIDAKSETDEAKRKAYIWEMQAMLHEDGGAVIPVFYDWIDAHHETVGGHTPHGGFEMDNGYILEKAFLKA